MEYKKSNQFFRSFIKYLISVILTITILELVDVDATKANVFAFEKFSLAVLVLFAICLFTFDVMQNGIIKWYCHMVNGKNKK